METKKIIFLFFNLKAWYYYALRFFLICTKVFNEWKVMVEKLKIWDFIYLFSILINTMEEEKFDCLMR